ncbi:hypothetical protein LguiA_023386 [Lonicera macranthoides]
MDQFDAARVLYRRILKLESEYVTRIVIGYLLLHYNSDQEMVRIAYCPDNVIINLIQQVKVQQGFILKPSKPEQPFSPYNLLSNESPLFNAFPHSRIPIPVVIGFPGMFNTNSLLSLDKFEMEITEMLKLRRVRSALIALLPMLYYETYGRVIQVEGYGLTKLLAQMKNIRLIDRPYGQQLVILEEDGRTDVETLYEGNDPGPIVSASKQIYLTFPAESTFTAEDVSNYFNTFGEVEEVRIPCQQKRMFGFVSFVSADTVKMILSQGNPHHVCGARVLVKPYKEKSQLVERRYQEKYEPPPVYEHSVDMDTDLQMKAEDLISKTSDLNCGEKIYEVKIPGYTEDLAD